MMRRLGRCDRIGCAQECVSGSVCLCVSVCVCVHASGGSGGELSLASSYLAQAVRVALRPLVVASSDVNGEEARY